MTVLDGEAIVDLEPDLSVSRDVRELHILAIPLEDLVEILQSDGGDTEVDHLDERTGLAEVGS